MIHNVKMDADMVSWYSDTDKKCVQFDDDVTAFCVLSTKKHIAVAQKQRVYIYTEDGVVCSTIDIPHEFPDVICIHDIFYEEENFMLVLAQYSGYDIACHFDPFTGQLSDWHYTK